MPVYTYRCDNCGIRFEQTQKYSDPVLTKCPECGKKSLKKVYTPVGIVFKGSGFYATDHRSPSGGKQGLNMKREETNTTEKTETKPESKHESKLESKPESSPSKDSSTSPAAEKA